MQKETLKRVSETTLQEPIELTVDVNPASSLHARLQKWGLLPKKRVFVMRPIFLGSLIRISKVLMSVDMKIPDGTNGKPDGATLLDANYQAIIQHAESLARIVAMAIDNKDREPSGKLVKFIVRNFTTAEMLGVLAHVLKQMDLTSFMSSIISVRGLNVLGNQTAAPVMPVNGKEVSL